MRVIIVDPAEVFRIGLWGVLSTYRPDLELVEHTGLPDPDLIVSLKPDLLITDLSVEPAARNAFIAGVKQLNASICVVVTSLHAPRAIVREVLKAGASGFLLKTMPAQDISRAIDRILRGETIVPLAAKGSAAAVTRSEIRQDPQLDSLSPREREVFDLAVWGWQNKEIAAHLSIGVKTVQTHRGHINDKLGVRSSADLVRMAVRIGALDPAIRPSRANRLDHVQTPHACGSATPSLD